MQLILKFLKQNPNFVSHAWATQVKLLRRNLPDITVIIIAMFFDRHKQCLRWSLSQDDTIAIQGFDKKFRGTAEIKKTDFESHLGSRATKYILEVVNKLAELELPKSVLLLLVLGMSFLEICNMKPPTFNPPMFSLRIHSRHDVPGEAGEGGQ